MTQMMTTQGRVDPASFELVLAAETLLCAPPRRVGNAGLPATEAAFERAPVAMDVLGKLLMGAANLDDATLTRHDAEAALGALANAWAQIPKAKTDEGTDTTAAATGIAVTAIAGLGSTASPEALTTLSATTGVAIIRGTNGLPAVTSGAARHDPDLTHSPTQLATQIAADLGRETHPAGIVGAVPLPADAVGEAAVSASAEVARAYGAALVFAPSTDLEAVARGLRATDRAGLDRARVIVTGAAALIGAVQPNGRADVGVDPARLAALEGFGTAICFDDLGRIPNVSTVVSDHDVATTILDLVSRGAEARMMLSSGIRHKHRLSSHGGNGLEFVPQQFAPYLRILGASDDTLRAVLGANAARIIARETPSSQERI